jgi:hypothetical protein
LRLDPRVFCRFLGRLLGIVCLWPAANPARLDPLVNQPLARCSQFGKLPVRLSRARHVLIARLYRPIRLGEGRLRRLHRDDGLSQRLTAR